MRIMDQSQVSFSVNRYQKNNNQIQKTLKQLSSGLKIATSSDNASGLSISEKMRAQIRGTSQAQSNMQDGLSLLEAANEGLNNVNGLLQRVRELAVESASDTMTIADREANQQEISQLLEAIDDTAANLEFNTQKILNEEKSLNLTIGANPGQKIALKLIDIGAESLGIADLDVLLNETANDTIAKLDDAINQTSLHLTKVGSTIESIEFHLRNALTFENNLSESLSLLEDADLAEEMMNYINLDIRRQGDQMLISHVNKSFSDILGIVK